MFELTPEQNQRYQRQLLIEGFGTEGQYKLLQSKILIVGTGGLGSPVAYYLAAAGVGTIGLIDSDTVELSNLNRQILHTATDIGRDKTDSARQKLHALNPELSIVEHKIRLTAENAETIFHPYHIVVDATDNYATRFLINDTCVQSEIPLVHAGVYGLKGQAFAVIPRKSACYRCLFPEIPPQDKGPTGQGLPILGSIPGIMGAIQATEAIKLVTGLGEPLIGRMLIFNGLEMSFRTMNLPRNPECPVCGEAAILSEP